MTRESYRSVAFVLAAAVLAGCSATTPSVRGEDRQAGFLLTISSPHLVWDADQPIIVSAEFSYLGPGSVTVSGPGPGSHVAFEIVELTGTRKMEPIWLLACVTWQMTRVPETVPFHKSGGYTAEDPDAAFYEAWLAEPEFRLPAGRWRVTALAPFMTGSGCVGGRDVNLRASFVITVR
jgi:hypothetical protein